jgi:hypothetical protein
MNKVEHEYSCLIYVCTCENTELDDLKAENARLREALELIAIPVRSDGTYNRSREACEQLAREALKGTDNE